MRTQRGFTLLEMIVALAVIAALLSVVVFSLIKRLDRIASEKEQAAMDTLGAAFKESVRRSRYVPDESSWATIVAAYLGSHIGRVTANDRNHPRIFLIDPAMQIRTNNAGGPLLPYAQPVVGSMVMDGTKLVPPINTRFMLISSIGAPLPSALVSGIGQTSGSLSFDNLWSTNLWGTNDVKIERINLADLFVKITLVNADTDSAHLARFGVDGSSLFGLATPAGGGATEFNSYYIKGSELMLYRNVDGTNVLEYSEILYSNQEFTFELGSWQAKPYLGRTVAANGKVLQRAMDLFLKAPLNPYARFGATQQQVHDAMTQYMSAFVAWRDASYAGEGCPGPVANNAYTDALAAARANLSAVTGNLISP